MEWWCHGHRQVDTNCCNSRQTYFNLFNACCLALTDFQEQLQMRTDLFVALQLRDWLFFISSLSPPRLCPILCVCMGAFTVRCGKTKLLGRIMDQNSSSESWKMWRWKQNLSSLIVMFRWKVLEDVRWAALVMWVFRDLHWTDFKHLHDCGTVTCYKRCKLHQSTDTFCRYGNAHLNHFICFANVHQTECECLRRNVTPHIKECWLVWEDSK